MQEETRLNQLPEPAHSIFKDSGRDTYEQNGVTLAQ